MAYVRWERRHRATRQHLGDLLVCRLVECERQGGKPRQRLIMQLGTVRETMPVNHRISFWNNVEWALGQLNLEPSEERAVRSKVSARVPYATETDRQR
ncbi:MAG: hypothetical protein K0S00_3991 [Xanthobacteraceae bacterium]|jgi:hypothetical protein|nr:hypothetical protein [Xanthobacteraceae bacterium]